MKTQLKPWILAGALILGAPCVSHAQETLGGLGAASAAGATLGAAGAGSLSSGRITRGVTSGSGGATDMGDEPGSTGDPRSAGSGGSPGALGGEGGAAATLPVKLTPPRLQSYNGESGDFYVRELLAVGPRPLPGPQSRQRSPRGQARYASRVARLSKKQRTREVQKKYKIPGVGWEAAYLPQDRYKFGKIWRFVSTEDDRFYYTPSGMARKSFRPNRVIGFSSFQDALAAGYRPDPVTRPAPGAEIARLAALSRGPELYRFVEYVYAGQVSTESFLGVYNYAMSVDSTLRPTRARPFIGETVAKVLDAALTGDVASIPTKFTSQGPVLPPPPVATTNGEGGMSGSGDPRMSGMTDPRMSGSGSPPMMPSPNISR